MLVFVYRRQKADATARPMRIKPDGPRTDSSILNRAEPVWVGGKQVGYASNAAKFNNLTQTLQVTKDRKLEWAYTQKVTNKTHREASICKSTVELDVADTAAMLEAILLNYGYAANDVLYNKLAKTGPVDVQVKTVVFWWRDGRRYQITINKIRVKAVNMTAYTALREDAFAPQVRKMQPHTAKRNGELITGFIPEPAIPVGRGARVVTNYSFFLCGKCIRDIAKKVRLAEKAYSTTTDMLL